jgi:hypothetical protein
MTGILTRSQKSTPCGWIFVLMDVWIETELRAPKSDYGCIASIQKYNAKTKGCSQERLFAICV